MNCTNNVQQVIDDLYRNIAATNLSSDDIEALIKHLQIKALQLKVDRVNGQDEAKAS